MTKKVVIDPGHGGEDSGAVGNGITEKDLNLKISKYIYDRLKKLGVDVFITRDSDETLTPNERVNRVLNAFGNSNDVLVVSNHINAGGGDGAEIIYALRNNDTFAKMILDELEKEGQNIRRAYQRRLPNNFDKDYYFMQRNTGNTESVTIEYGFLDSKGDDINQLKNNWKKYAEAVVRAISNYIGIPYSNLNNNYIVKSGDSLWSIAKKYNISVDDLKKNNNLKSNLINVGQVLNILNDDNNTIYKVKSGDTLYGIAKMFNIGVLDIMNLNGLTNNLLKIGDELLIPSALKKQYIVKAGDNLYKISKMFDKTIDDIKMLNNLTSDTLSIGQILEI